MKSNEFVSRILDMCGVTDVDLVTRQQINHAHVKILCDFLSKKTDILLLRLFQEADGNRTTVHLAGESDDFAESDFFKMPRKARILVCRIIGSQGREIEITRNGVIVSPHVEILKKAKVCPQEEYV